MHVISCKQYIKHALEFSGFCIFTEAVMDRQPGMQRRSISDALLLALKHMPKRKGGPLYRVSYLFIAAFALTTFLAAWHL